MAALLSDKEEKSLIDWLTKANDHAASLEPTHYNATTQKRESIKQNRYRDLINDHKKRLACQQTAIDHIKAWRDKAIAHFDTRFFFDHQDLAAKYPLTYADIDRLMDMISDILRKHYSCLFGRDPRPELLSLRNVDKLLKYAGAFNRARNDRDLIRKGFKPINYTQEN
jgi:hypothetical protein